MTKRDGIEQYINNSIRSSGYTLGRLATKDVYKNTKDQFIALIFLFLLLVIIFYPIYIAYKTGKTIYDRAEIDDKGNINKFNPVVLYILWAILSPIGTTIIFGIALWFSLVFKFISEPLSPLSYKTLGIISIIGYAISVWLAYSIGQSTGKDETLKRIQQAHEAQLDEKMKMAAKELFDTFLIENGLRPLDSDWNEIEHESGSILKKITHQSNKVVYLVIGRRNQRAEIHFNDKFVPTYFTGIYRRGEQQ